jgi:hypothetical protein
MPPSAGAATSPVDREGRGPVARQGVVIGLTRAASARPMTAPSVAVVMVLVVTLYATGFVLPSGAALLIGILVVVRAWRADAVRRRYVLRYTLDEPTQRQFSARIAALRALGKSERLWDAGGSSWAIQRQHDDDLATSEASNVQIGPVKLRHFATNVPTVGITTAGQTVLFLPDQVLVQRAGRYASTPYASLEVDCGSLQVTSRVDPPADATVLGQAWVHSRTEGGADGRRGHTPKQMVLQFAQLSFRAPEALDLVIDVSNEALAYACKQAFRPDTPDAEAGARAGARGRPSGARGSGARAGGRARSAGAAHPAATQQYAAACAVLNVAPGASQDEVRAAYRRLARQYHPDTVQGSAPEFVDVAERRMREINAAYETLSRTKVG